MNIINERCSVTLKQVKEKINYKVLSITLIAFIGIIILMYLLSGSWSKCDTLRIAILSSLGTIQSLLIVFALWETIAKKSFAEEILTLSNISKNINASGIEYIYVNFLEIDWRAILKDANELTIVFTYGKTWRDSHRDALDRLCQRGGKIKIYLPNFQDDMIVDELDKRFSYEKGKTKSLIRDTSKAFRDIGAEVFYYNGTFQSSYYLVDDISYMSFFNHRKEKGTVPAIKAVKGGTLYSYIADEIAAIHKDSIFLKDEEHSCNE